MERYERNRLRAIRHKPGATARAFFELEWLINQSRFASQYFKESLLWFTERMNYCEGHSRHSTTFTEEEYHQVAEAFRDLARRLERHADEIDAARMPVWEKFPWEDWMDEEGGEE
ncbi:MAG: DUF5053 domain-containing protein [Marinilabiliaceae bacterium]